MLATSNEVGGGAVGVRGAHSRPWMKFFLGGCSRRWEGGVREGGTLAALDEVWGGALVSVGGGACLQPRTKLGGACVGVRGARWRPRTKLGGGR